jgi:hypothetical protein
VLPYLNQVSITVSAILDNMLNPRLPFSSCAEVLLPHLEAVDVADAMIEALHHA